MPDRVLPCLLLAALAYTLLNLGLVLEKRGAAALPAIERAGALRSLRNFLTSPAWVFGFLLTNVQIVPLLAALSLGPVSLVSPMLGFGLVVLVLCSRFWLGERITPAMAAGIGLTIVGIIGFGLASTTPPVALGWEGGLRLASSGPALAVFFILLGGSLLPGLASAAAGWRAADVLFGVASGAAASLGLVASKLVTAGLGDGEALWPRLAELPFWGLLVVLIAGNAGSMVLQQFGFQKGRAVIVAPIYSAGFIVLPALAGVVLFDEWAGSSWPLLVLRSAALLAILGGAGLLSLGGRAEPRDRVASPAPAVAAAPFSSDAPAGPELSR